jgi:sensor histidine kinase YesM
MPRRFPRTIHHKLIFITIVPVLFIALAAVLTAYTVGAAVSNMGALFQRNYYIQELLGETSAAENHLSLYMSSKNSENLRRYIYYSRVLSERIRELDSTIHIDEGSLLERNIAVLIGEFIAAGDAAVQAKRGRNTPEYASYQDTVRELGGQIRERSSALRLFLLDKQLSSFTLFSRTMRRVMILNSAAIGAALLFGTLIILYFTQKISAPISRLGAEAKKIARGVFDETILNTLGDDEISAAARAFNLMKKSIQDSINEIQQKAEVERALLQERMKNLEMTGLLRKAELEALQARINPHFLFNALNTGFQLAVVEEAEKTGKFLEQLASLMRYSFRESDNSMTTLSEEFEHLQSYLYLMTIRFPGVFDIDVSLGEETRNALIPKMTIQPLAENAISHGLQMKTAEARLSVRGRLDRDRLVIKVEDNGIGISESRIREIFSAVEQKHDVAQGQVSPESAPGSHGHGLVNVILRLRHFSGSRDVCSIEPLEPGTRITISIPYREAS